MDESFEAVDLEEFCTKTLILQYNLLKIKNKFRLNK